MRNKEFTNAMNKIVGQAEAQQQEEIRRAARAERFRRIFKGVRAIFVVLLLAALGVFGFNHRDQLKNYFSPKPAADTTAKADTALNGARQAAAERDQIIDGTAQ
jgi:hypothetical protein